LRASVSLRFRRRSVLPLCPRASQRRGPRLRVSSRGSDEWRSPPRDYGNGCPTAAAIARSSRCGDRHSSSPDSLIDADIWAYRHRIHLVFIRPGKPVENAYIESFHNRFRDECLSAHWFLDIADARFQIEQFRGDYNELGHTPVLGIAPRRVYHDAQFNSALPHPPTLGPTFSLTLLWGEGHSKTS
jgi:transposase InsO family protein